MANTTKVTHPAVVAALLGQVYVPPFAEDQTARDAARYEAPFPPIERYDPVGLLGCGGQSVVYKVVERSTGSDFAFKLQRYRSPVESALFKREIRTLGQLASPRAPALYDFGDVERNQYIVMEYIPGFSLASRQALPTPAQRIDSGLPLLAPLAERIGLIHSANLVHGDLKEQNIILASNGPRIIDFALARPAGTSSARTLPEVPEAEGSIFGTPVSMAPEQIVADGIILPQTDIYAFGLIAHALLTGRPFRNFSYGLTPESTIAEIVKSSGRVGYQRPTDLPGRLVELIETCTQPKQEDRFRNVDEIVSQLRQT